VEAMLDLRHYPPRDVRKVSTTLPTAGDLNNRLYSVSSNLMQVETVGRSMKPG